MDTPTLVHEKSPLIIPCVAVIPPESILFNPDCTKRNTPEFNPLPILPITELEVPAIPPVTTPPQQS
jgi:hypothetical protein